jgi:hypothetical protein
LRLAAVTLGALQAYAGRHYLNADGVSYLDLADAWGRGDWAGALNTYWSPLYPWLLALGRAALRPTPYWEVATTKLVGFAVYVGAALAFEFLLRELLLWRRPALSERAVVGFAYALFLLTSLGLISLEPVTPDLCVALLVYLAAGLMTRCRRLGFGPARSALLGLVLGAAYLAKAALLPLGFFFLVVSAWAVGRKRLAHVAAAGAAWALVAGGYAMALSLHAGRPTTGDAAGLNYLWFVNGVELFGWRTSDTALGRPEHPPRPLLAEPPVFAFAEPVGGTYPLWYDPAYWCAGLHARWRPGEQWEALTKAGTDLLTLLVVQFGVCTAALAVLTLFGRSAVRGDFWRTLGAEYPLWLPALFALGLYSLVHIQGRYVAPFLTLAGLGLLCGLRLAVARVGRYVPLLLLGVWLPVGALAVSLVGRAAAGVRGGEGASAHADWAVAQELARHGVGPGSRVAVVGDAFECGWARLGGVRIVAQVGRSDAPRYWADVGRRRAVHEAFRRAGAVAAVARSAPAADAWLPVPGGSYHVLLLGRGGGTD